MQMPSSNPVLFIKEGSRRVIRLLVIELLNLCDQIAFYAFHSFLVEVQMNACYIDYFVCTAHV